MNLVTRTLRFVLLVALYLGLGIGVTRRISEHAKGSVGPASAVKFEYQQF